MADTATTFPPQEESKLQNPMKKLEDALVICEFGKFHVKLMITSLISVLATTTVTTATSYILPSAECDMKMDMMQKGLINAMPFVGQTCTVLFTGFMIDAFGRKIFLATGNLCLFACSVFGASSQNYWMLMVSKLCEGVLMSVTFTATATMVTEFTHKNVRDRVMLLYSSMMPLSIIITTLLAWLILSQSMHFEIVEGYFVLHSWNIYLYVCSAWSLMAAILYCQLPESPKFLFSHGKEKDALDVLKTIYKINTGNEKYTFPIDSLNNISDIELPSTHMGFKKQITHSLYDAKKLFQKTNFLRLSLFSFITFVCLLSYSALRLWYPQLSTIVENYKHNHNEEPTWFCDIISDHNEKQFNKTTNISSNSDINTCSPELAGTETYINGILLGFVSLVSISVSGWLVHHFGQKPLIFVFFILCSICSGLLYWTNSSIQIAMIISGLCGFMHAAFSLIHNILVRVFSTSVRNLSLSIILMVGRIGSVIGNILFPLMLQNGCMMPFITLSVVTLVVASSVYLLPNPRKENKETGDR